MAPHSWREWRRSWAYAREPRQNNRAGSRRGYWALGGSVHPAALLVGVGRGVGVSILLTMKRFRYGYLTRDPQPRLTPKSAFLRKLERAQKASQDQTCANVHPIKGLRSAERQVAKCPRKP